MRRISLNILIIPHIFAFKENLFDTYQVLALVASAGTFPLPIKFHFFLCQIFPEIFLLQTFRFLDQVHSTSNMCNWGGLKQHYWIHFSPLFIIFIISQQHSKGGNSTLLNYTKFKYTLSGRGVLYVPGPT